MCLRIVMRARALASAFKNRQTNCFAGFPQQERDEWKELEAGLTLNIVMYRTALPFGWCQGLLELYKASSTRREAVPKNQRQRGTKELDCGAGGLIAQELIELKCRMSDYILHEEELRNKIQSL